MSFTSAVGALASLCTTLSYIPQVKKIWVTKRTEDLSLKTFSILAAGIALWVIYGVLQGDAMIIVGNLISLCFLAFILFYKLRQDAMPTQVSRGGHGGMSDEARGGSVNVTDSRVQGAPSRQ